METEKLNSKRQEIIKEQQRLKRLEVLSQNRKITTVNKALLYVPGYLQTSNPVAHTLIDSMQSPIPNPLPPLSASTISYYRRANVPVWVTRDPNRPEGALENLHLLHESLWMLTVAKQAQYQNYPAIVAEFQANLRNYLQCPYRDICEMAVIVAGNKVIGHESDILAISQENFWVLGNHIGQSRLPIQILLPFILQNRSQAYQVLYELSESPLTEPLLHQENSQILFHLVNHLNNSSQELSLPSLRIIGNLLYSKEEFVDELIKLDVVKELQDMLGKGKRKTKEEVCWALSNIAFGTRGQSTHVLHNNLLLSKLLAMLCTETTSVRQEILQIFTGLVSKAEPASIFRLIQKQELLKCLAEQKDVDELVPSLRRIMQQIVNLVKSHTDESESRLFILGLKKFNFEDFLPDQISLQQSG